MKYRTVVVSPEVMINQPSTTYEEARLLADCFLEEKDKLRPLTVVVYGPHARTGEETRYWSYEVR
jgi:hypothetical protein